MSAWILILVVAWGDGATSQQAEFQNRTACETARAAALDGIKTRDGVAIARVAGVCLERPQ